VEKIKEILKAAMPITLFWITVFAVVHLITYLFPWFWDLFEGIEK